MITFFPNRFRCPHCRAALRYHAADGWTWAFVVACLAAAILVIPLFRHLPMPGSGIRRLLALTVAMVLFTSSSYGFVLIMRHARRLVAR
jgi:hypothetical protein